MSESSGGTDSLQSALCHPGSTRADGSTDALLRMATRLARFGAWSIDLQTGAITWSDEVRALHEVDVTFTPTPETAIGFYAPECAPVIREAFERCATLGEPYDLELKLITARGNYIWVHTIGECRRNARGTIVRIEGAFQDITPQKRIREEYQQLAERLTATLESITDAFFAVDRQWRFTYLNGQGERILGKPREHFLGRTLWEEFPHHHSIVFREHYDRALSLNSPVHFEEFYSPLSAWFEVHAYPSDHGLAVYFRDITARKQAQQRLAQRAALLNHASDAILVRDSNSVIRLWNKAAERIYGWPEAEAIGRNEAELLGHEPDELKAALQLLFERGEWTGELRQKTKSGAMLVVQSRWTLVPDLVGESYSVLVINSDITRQKLVEEQLLRAQRMDSIGTLAAGIAHDMNNILAPVLMGAALLRSGLPTVEVDKLISTIEISAQRGAALVRKLLIFGRGIEGEHRPVDVGAIIDEVATITRQTFPRNIKITTCVSPHLPQVNADPIQVQQVLLNLAVNARDALPAGGELAISADRVHLDPAAAALQDDAVPGVYVRVRVADTGTGIPPEIIGRIFDPFFTTKPHGKGTGLGLSSVLGIVKSHHGFVRVASQVGQGTEFIVHLPATENVQPSASAEAEDLSVARGNGELVMIVDDEEPVRSVLRQLLLRYNYNVVSAENGVDAVAVFAANPRVKVVVADVDMPMMDGVTLMRVLKRMNPAVNLVMCTGAGRPFEPGDTDVTADFIAKPFTAHTFATAIATALRRRTAVSPFPGNAM